MIVSRPGGHEGKGETMRLVDAEGTTIATINTNHSMSLDEAINLVGEIITDMNDPRYDDEDGNVIIDDNRYQYDELDLWPDVDIEAARRLGRECAESIDVADIGDDWEADAAGFVNAWGFCDDTDPEPRFMMDDVYHVNRDAADAWNEGFQEGWVARKAECDKEEGLL